MNIKKLYEQHGFFSLIYEKIERWGWYTDLPCKSIMVHLIIKCMKVDYEYKGETIKRGQYRTSLNRLSSETGLSFKQVRTALDKLEFTGEIKRAKSRAKQRTIITLCKFEEYQPELLEKGKGRGKRGAKYKEETKETKKESEPRQAPQKGLDASQVYAGTFGFDWKRNFPEELTRDEAEKLNIPWSTVLNARGK